MKNFFNESDFSDCFRWNDQYGSPLEAVTDVANKKLNKLREESLVVHGFPDAQVWSSHRVISGTHKAVITFIEELPKKECIHEPDYIEWGHLNPKCKHCFVELKAEWSAK